jgi:hypothetical protein
MKNKMMHEKKMKHHHEKMEHHHGKAEEHREKFMGLAKQAHSSPAKDKKMESKHVRKEKPRASKK